MSLAIELRYIATVKTTFQRWLRLIFVELFTKEEAPPIPVMTPAGAVLVKDIQIQCTYKGVQDAQMGPPTVMMYCRNSKEKPFHSTRSLASSGSDNDEDQDFVDIKKTLQFIVFHGDYHENIREADTIGSAEIGLLDLLHGNGESKRLPLHRFGLHVQNGKAYIEVEAIDENNKMQLERLITSDNSQGHSPDRSPRSNYGYDHPSDLDSMSNYESQSNYNEKSPSSHQPSAQAGYNAWGTRNATANNSTEPSPRHKPMPGQIQEEPEVVAVHYDEHNDQEKLLEEGANPRKPNTLSLARVRDAARKHDGLDATRAELENQDRTLNQVCVRVVFVRYLRWFPAVFHRSKFAVVLIVCVCSRNKHSHRRSSSSRKPHKTKRPPAAHAALQTPPKSTSS